VRAKWRWCARKVGWCAASGYLDITRSFSLLIRSIGAIAVVREVTYGIYASVVGD
jgi:hypothetical protein